MKFEGGRAKPENLPVEETIETRLLYLAEVKAEIKKHYAEYERKTKELREIKKSLENIITEEVKRMKKTVSVGNIRAEYIPQVQIRMKKEKNDEQ